MYNVHLLLRKLSNVLTAEIWVSWYGQNNAIKYDCCQTSESQNLDKSFPLII